MFGELLGDSSTSGSTKHVFLTVLMYSSPSPTSPQPGGSGGGGEWGEGEFDELGLSGQS